MLCHDPGAPAQHYPGQQGADDGVADAGPGGGNSVFPAKLPRIAYKHHRGEIGGAVGEGGEPRPYGAPSQHEAIHVSGIFSAVEADADEYGEIND